MSELPGEILDHMQERDPLPAGIRTASYSPYCVGSHGVPSQIAATIAEYPEPLLAASGLREIGACSRIVDSRGEEAGLAELGAHRILIADGGRDATAVIHHEMFHLLDYEHWSGWHPIDRPFPRGSQVGLTRPHGFVDDYATTNATEDKASTYEYVMARPEELCAIAREDRVVRAKAALIWSFVADLAGSDTFLRRHAACVEDSIKPDE